MDGGVLGIDPKYFEVTGGGERWLYRVARKHAGRADGLGFAISAKTPFEKSGAAGCHWRFKFEMERMVERNNLPEFFLAWEADPKTRSPRCAWRASPSSTSPIPAMRFPATDRSAKIGKSRGGLPNSRSRWTNPLPATLPPKATVDDE